MKFSFFHLKRKIETYFFFRKVLVFFLSIKTIASIMDYNNYMTTTEITLNINPTTFSREMVDNLSVCFNETLTMDNSSTLPQWDQVQFLVNVTQDVPYKYAVVLFGYILPFLLIITIIANTLIVIVLAQTHMRTPTNLVLLAMAIADLLTLVFPAPWYFYMYTFGNHAKILYPPSACYTYHLMVEVTPAFFHTASIWLTLLLAGQRYIYVCHLTAARTWCTLPRVCRAMVLIFIMAFIHQSTRIADRDYTSVDFIWNNSRRTGCQFETAKWVRDNIGEDMYFIFYFGFRIVFVHMGPCALLVALNVLLFRALKRAQRKREKLFNENRKSECIKLRDSNSTTIMLIVIVSVFLMLEIPLAVTTILHVAQSTLNIEIAAYDSLNTTILFTNFFIILSYPINFAIYCGMSKQFRQTFADLFLYNNYTATVAAHRECSSRYSAVNGTRNSTNETIL